MAPKAANTQSKSPAKAAAKPTTMKPRSGTKGKAGTTKRGNRGS